MDDTWPLADVADLAAYIDQDIDPSDVRAKIYLDIASGMVRDRLHQQLTEVQDDVIELDPINGYVLLPELPISTVTLLEIFDGTTWSPADPSTYTVAKRIGMIAGKPGCGVRWPTDPETWRVTYSHGYVEIPNTLVGIVLGVAARGYVSPVGIDMERVGNYQAKYSAAVAFTPIEEAALSRYQVPRLA